MTNTINKTVLEQVVVTSRNNKSVRHWLEMLISIS